MRQLFLYVWFVFKADTKASRIAGMKAARKWCKERHSVHWTDAYRNDFRAFTSAYQRAHCHQTAKRQLATLKAEGKL